MKLTELMTQPTPAEAYAREHEMVNEDNIKHAIQNGKGTKTIANAYQVSEAFVIKCRKELRNDGGL